MQSANGLAGTGINLNGATGAAGDSDATGGLTTWDVTDNDVLKIVDIGFVQSNSGTIGASLNFAFDIQDGDGDLLGVQNIPVQVGTTSSSTLAAAASSTWSTAKSFGFADDSGMAQWQTMSSLNQHHDGYWM